jgi:hypothetical protein
VSRIRTTPALLAVLLCLIGPGAAHAAGITNSGDDLRTGWYPDQRTLSPQVVSGRSGAPR